MQTLLIPKSGGRVRKVYCPDPELKRRLRSLVPQLNLIAEELDVYHVCHGFTEGRSPVTNAKEHIGFEFTVSFDLDSFFDSVTAVHVQKALGRSITYYGINLNAVNYDCFPDGAARQGLPTSPALANIAFSPADRDIMALCPKGRFSEAAFCFTRYADDLTFSCRTQATVDLLLQEIPRIVERHGFKLNTGKTTVQCAKAGRRMITGIAVGEHDIALPRETRRRLRAANHQDTAGLKRRNVRRLLFNRNRWTKRLPLRLRFYWQMKGLREWSKLKPPKEQRQPANVVVRAAARVVTAIAGQGTCNRLFGVLGIRKFG